MKMVDWRKNDKLLKSALMKMDLRFFRDKKTWEPHVLKRKNRKSAFEVACYDDNDNLVIEGVDTPASLGEVKMFVWGSAFGCETENIFYGVKSYEELAVKLDLTTQRMETKMLDSSSLAEVVHKNIVLWKLFKDKHVYGEHGVYGIVCRYDPYRKSYSFSMVAKDCRYIDHQSLLYTIDENGLWHVYRNDSWMNKDLCPKTWLWPSVYLKDRLIARANFLDMLAADNMDQCFTCFRGNFAFNRGEVMQRIVETELKLDANDKEIEDDIVKQIRGIDERMPELPFQFNA